MDERPLISSAYRQKSKLFLWPLVRIKRTVGLKPLQTFLIDPSQAIYETDYKIIAPFFKDPTERQGVFDEDDLLTNEFFHDFYETDKLLVYVFDLRSYNDDFDKFLEGRYTEYSKASKALVNMYYGSKVGLNFKPHPQVDAYLNPKESTYVKVADQLEIDVYELIKGVEIVDPPDLEKETFYEDTVIRSNLSTRVPD